MLNKVKKKKVKYTKQVKANNILLSFLAKQIKSAMLIV